MDWKAVAIPAALVVLVGSAVFSTKGYMTISAGEIEANESNGAIRGSFTVKAQKPIVALLSQRTIRSDGIGGACLVADPEQLKYVFDLGAIRTVATTNCTKNADCNPTSPKLPDGWSGYCDAYKCWVRPGSQMLLCRVSRLTVRPGIDYNWKWTDGVVNSVPSPAARLEGSIGPMTWRVVACLAPASFSAACGTPGDQGEVQVFGKSKSVFLNPPPL